MWQSGGEGWELLGNGGGGGRVRRWGWGVDPGMYTYCCSGILYDI